MRKSINYFVKVIILLSAVLICLTACSFGTQPPENTEKQVETVTQEETEPIIQAEEIRIDSIPTQMEAGTSFTVKYALLPDGAQGNVIITSSDEDVISVEGEQLIANKSGEAKITVKSDELSETAEIKVFVKADEIKVTPEEMKLTIGESGRLKYKILPSDARKSEVKFSTDNNKVVTVTKKGYVKSVGVGTANITVSTENGEVTAVCPVTVEPVYVKTIKLDETNVTLGKGQSYRLLSSVSPSNATFKDVSWETSNSKVVTVNNGAIQAKGVGEATVTAVTDEGRKTASCKIKVQQDAPKNKVYYIRSTYNVREYPNEESNSLTKAVKNSAVELLADGGSYLKVRASDGTVGFIIASKDVLSTVKPVMISNVPYINQFNIGLPTGCEAVSATMVLQYYGYKVTPEQVIAATPTGKGKYQVDGVWYAANPFEEFVGDPHKRLKDGSYGCFSKPIVTAMNTFAGGRAKNISGCSESELYRYVAAGKPVVVWGVRDGGQTTNGVTWKYVDKDGNLIDGSYKELVHEHCFVLIGYDDKYVYLNDPSAGKNATQTKAAFSRNWNKLYKQAIVIE